METTLAVLIEAGVCSAPATAPEHTVASKDAYTTSYSTTACVGCTHQVHGGRDTMQITRYAEKYTGTNT